MTATKRKPTAGKAVGSFGTIENVHNNFTPAAGSFATSKPDDVIDAALREWPVDDVIGAERIHTLRRFAVEMVGKLPAADILGAAEYANTALCRPPLAAEHVALAVSLATSSALSEDAVRGIMPAPEPEHVETVTQFPSWAETPAQAQAEAGLQSPDGISAAGILKNNYLIKGWLGRETVSVLFGQWNAGKTFSVLHLGVHIAAGKPWLGNRVRAGGVLYIGYEGVPGLPKRIEALKREFSEWDWPAIPFRWVGFNQPLVHPGTTRTKGREKLDKVIDQFKADTGKYPALIIVDTLRSALGGSDSNTDYTEPYLILARQIRDTIGAAVLTLHHPGHGDKTRGRGDSGLDGAWDTSINIAEGKGTTGEGTMYPPKQRDGRKDGRLFYRLKVVELGTDDDGDPVTTCVFEQRDPPVLLDLKGDPAKAWKALSDGHLPGATLTEAQAREVCRSAGVAANHVTRALAKLAEKKLIEWDKALEIVKLPADLFPSSEDGDE